MDLLNRRQGHDEDHSHEARAEHAFTHAHDGSNDVHTHDATDPEYANETRATPVHDTAPETDSVEETRPVRATDAHVEGAYEVRPALGSLTARIGLTLLGGGMMILAAFLAWYSDQFAVNGTQVSYRVFDPMSETDELAAGFLTSAGLVVLVLGALALLGLAFRSGWVTRIAAALGIVAFALYSIRLYRATDSGFWSDLGLGAWMLLAGSVIALAGGFMGSARKVVVPDDASVVRKDRHGRVATAS